MEENKENIEPVKENEQEVVDVQPVQHAEKRKPMFSMKTPLMEIPRPKLNFSLKGLPLKIVSTLKEYRRVIMITRKPDLEEISKISKISLIGIAVIGLMGFLIQITFQLIVRGI